jgi:hypothetical protein
MAVNNAGVAHKRQILKLRGEILGHKVAIATHRDKLVNKRAILSSLNTKKSNQI